MGKNTVAVTLRPAGQTVHVQPGTSLRDAAVQGGVVIDYPCGGEGSCGKCKVRLEKPSGTITPAERTLLHPKELDAGVRLACQTVIEQSIVAEVPERPAPSEAYPVLASITDGEGSLVDLPVHIGQLRHSREDASCFVAAFDVGTTTLAGILIDLADGRVCAQTSCMNPQRVFGDDVISRIAFATQDWQGRERLQSEATDVINEMLEELVNEMGASLDCVLEIALAGNTTMQHLVAGLDPASLGQAPFSPASYDSMLTPAKDMGIRIHPEARAYLFPVIDGFVGGDTVAGIVATSLAQTEGPGMFLDIGTNGEIVISCKDRLIATSCAAGPAFEAARITHGMRTGRGAIEAVRIAGEVTFCTIGNVAPKGLCGSALIDLMADLLRHGILTSDGRFSGPGRISAGIRERLVTGEPDSAGFVVAFGDETRTGEPIILYQRDVRELQLATGAIRAGIATMLQGADLQPSDLERLVVGGAFGNYIRCENAQRIGLFPPELDPGRIAFLGNTALAGARCAAVSQRTRDLAGELAQSTEHIDLSQDPHFHDTFAEAMVFPPANDG